LVLEGFYLTLTCKSCTKHADFNERKSSSPVSSIAFQWRAVAQTSTPKNANQTQDYSQQPQLKLFGQSRQQLSGSMPQLIAALLPGFLAAYYCVNLVENNHKSDCILSPGFIHGFWQILKSQTKLSMSEFLRNDFSKYHL
jgi:hypothetical protein